MAEPKPRLESLAAATHAAVLGGDLGDADHVLRRLASVGSPEPRAWHAAIRACGFLLAPDRFTAPHLADLTEFCRQPPRVRGVACLALTDLERRSVIGFELAELRACVEVHERLLEGTVSDVGPEAHLWLQAGRSWVLLMEGTVAEFDTRAAALERAALDARIAPLVIDVSAMRSLAAALSGDDASCIETARRASRMARTEALPAQEFLAHLVLARARRLSRNPHLAIRILTALGSIVSEPFVPWLAWELLLAGDLEVSRALLDSVTRPSLALDAARALWRLQEVAAGGDRKRFDPLCAALREGVSGSAFARREAETVLGAIDFRAPAADPALGGWCGGKSTVSPADIHGLCVRAEAAETTDDTSEAYVLARPDAPPRRILGIGAGLVDLSGLVRLRRTRRKQGRVETMAAVVALAGSEGIGVSKGFEAAYGFAYDPDVHRGVLEVLLPRVRAYLQDTAELVRAGGRLRFEPHCPLLVPDPRCAPRAYDRLLRILAREGRTRASDAARQVGLSVRAVQIALKELIETGACSSEKDGRQVLYLVEDTTFSEPTRRLALRPTAGSDSVS